MRVLAALWSLATVLAVLGAAALVAYGELLASNIGQAGSLNDRLWQLINALYAATQPLFLAALLVVLIALCTHALLWARAEEGPESATSRLRPGIPSR